MYFGSDHHFVSLRSDGSLRWKTFTLGRVRSSPAIGPDGAVYIGSDDTNLYKLDPGTGAILWKHRLGLLGLVRSSPNGRLYAVHPDGTEKWHFATLGPIDSSPAVSADAIVYVGSDDGRLYAIRDGPVPACATP